MATLLSFFVVLVSVTDSQSQEGFYTSEIFASFTGPCPRGSIRANGQLLNIQDYVVLFTVLGTRYGGDGQITFGVPCTVPGGCDGSYDGDGFAGRSDLRWCISPYGAYPPRPGDGALTGAATEVVALAADYCGDASSVVSASGLPGLGPGVQWCRVAQRPQVNAGPNQLLTGYYGVAASVESGFIGQMILVPGTCPAHTAAADGAILQISGYSAVYSIYGTQHGGDGQTTFALPRQQAPTGLQWCVVVSGYYPSVE